jgi:hypothetical protein
MTCPNCRSVYCRVADRQASLDRFDRGEIKTLNPYDVRRMLVTDLQAEQARCEARAKREGSKLVNLIWLRDRAAVAVLRGYEKIGALDLLDILAELEDARTEIALLKLELAGTEAA